MSYEIIHTLNGPVIKSDNQYFTMLDTHLMIDLAEKDESFLTDLRAGLTAMLNDGLDEYLEAFEAGIQHPPTKIYTYLNSCGQYFGFMYGAWAAYNNAKNSQ